MTNKKLRHAFNMLIIHANNAKCEGLHHSISQRHEIGFVCPAEYEIQKQANIVREYMKEHIK